METLLNTEQVAEQVMVPVATVRWWRHAGTGPASIKIGRHVRYRQTDVETWLQQNTTSTSRSAPTR